MSKRLIINADDFGMTMGVNRAVVEARQSGVLTSTTLMATGAAYEEAVQLAAQVKTLDVGCHVVLLEGSPLLPAAEIPSLAVKGVDGVTRFRRGFGAFIQAAIAGKLRGEDIYREARAQILHLRAAGVDVQHLDTHKHAHVFPAVFRPLLRAALDCGVAAVRNPFEPMCAMSWHRLRHRRDLWSRYLPVRMLHAFSDQFAAECQNLGIATPQGTFGITLTGYADEPSFIELLDRIPDGNWELLCHPAYEDELWLKLGPRPGSGMRELELLLSPHVSATVRDNGIMLASYAEVFAGSRAAVATAASAVPVLGDAAAPAA
ncbi:MAG: carbohydrate deacetylase [Terriglobales bacterium]